MDAAGNAAAGPQPTAFINPPPIEACFAGQSDALELLLERDPTALHAVDVVRHAGLLHWASHKGDVGILRSLLARNLNLEAPDAEGMVPLHFAAAAGRRAAASLLLDAGAQVDARAAPSQTTPLILAAGGGHVHCVELFLTRNADITAGDAVRQTALIAAARGGHGRVVRALLAARADPAAVDAVNLRTALHWASCYGHGPVVEALLQANAALVNLPDSEQ